MKNQHTNTQIHRQYNYTFPIDNLSDRGLKHWNSKKKDRTIKKYDQKTINCMTSTASMSKNFRNCIFLK